MTIQLPSVRCCVAGGGPAGMVLGLLLARAGVSVTVLEKHADFLRDFRGDTVHPSTLQVLEELGLLGRFLQRPHDKVHMLRASVGGQEVDIADFSRLRHPYIVLMPQWEFLDFLHDEARRYPGFRLLRNTEAQALLYDGERVAGVRCLRRGVAAGDESLRQIRADLVVAADGRHSALRAAAELPLQDLGAPIDVLWMRLPRATGDPAVTGGRIERGRFLVTLNRGDYWQCAYVIPKGGIEALRARGLPAFRRGVADMAPFFADRIEAALPDWDAVKLLSVTVDRLEQWSRPGLLAIGDAAHAMSPIGGVGINLAVQDAVATANLLAATLADPKQPLAAIDAVLPAVQQRRLFPVRVTQSAQVAIQNRLLSPLLAEAAAEGEPQRLELPWLLRATRHWNWLRTIPAALVGVGARPEHVHSPDAFGP